LPIRDGKTGLIHGCIFYTAYLHADDHGQARPLTFIWNGGPGANSTYLHLEAFGPRRLISGERPTDPEPSPLRFEDNPNTLLDQSDLVFIDPVGTGYSRVAQAGTEAEFFNTIGDAASVAEAIRVYRQRFGAQAAPLFLMGESYGVWRAASVAQLLEEHGAQVAGVVLISGGVPVGPVLTPELKTALFIPNRTAAAFAYGKLAPDLQRDFDHAVAQSTRWATEVYAPALASAETLTPPQRAAIVSGLSRYTGLSVDLIDAKTLVLPRKVIGAHLAEDQHKTLGVLDVRVTTPEETSGARTRLIERYLSQDLAVKNELPYLGINDDGYAPLGAPPSGEMGDGWTYNLPAGVKPLESPDKALHPTAAAAFAAAMDGPPGGSQPWLIHAAAINPHLKVLIVAGWFDSLNSCAGNDYLVAHLAPPLNRNTTALCYHSGHMIYRDRDARFALRADLRKFYDAVAREGPQ
jgi:carboxypeptidase C (cathepsin A)